jgi:sugar phosphate isomerase/epimerase
MNESIFSCMKVGLIHFMAYPSTMNGEGPILETIKKIAFDDYFNAIEVSWIKDPAIRGEVGKVLGVSHMTVGYGSQPRLLTTGLNINDLDEKGRQTALASLTEGIDKAYELKAVGFAFMSGKYDKARLDESYAALVESAKELCLYTKRMGTMKVLLEVFDHEVDKKSLIGPAALAKAFAVEIRRDFDNFGLIVDSSHIPLLGESIEGSLLPVKGFIRQAHMGNCVAKDPSLPAYGDMHPRFGFPGSENDAPELAAYLKVLMDIGFLNKEDPPIVSFEVKPSGDEDPEIVIANAKRTLNLAWARV